MSTTVVNLHRESTCDVYIGRPSRWGNPYKIGPDGTRADVIAKYRAWLVQHPTREQLLDDVRGKRLGCFCKPLPCHGDVLAELADAREEAPPMTDAAHVCPKAHPLCSWCSRCVCFCECWRKP